MLRQATPESAAAQARARRRTQQKLRPAGRSVEGHDYYSQQRSPRLVRASLPLPPAPSCVLSLSSPPPFPPWARLPSPPSREVSGGAGNRTGKVHGLAARGHGLLRLALLLERRHLVLVQEHVQRPARVGDLGRAREPCPARTVTVTAHPLASGRAGATRETARTGEALEDARRLPSRRRGADLHNHHRLQAVHVLGAQSSWVPRELQTHTSWEVSWPGTCMVLSQL